jgi:hypothetical protein
MKIRGPQPDLGELPSDYQNDDAIIAEEQAAPSVFAGCTALMSALFRALVPNRWPKS